MTTSKKDNFIIGIQIGITSGCAVYRNGEIIFAASDVRYSQIKNDTAFPVVALMNAVKFCGISKINIEKVASVGALLNTSLNLHGYPN